MVNSFTYDAGVLDQTIVERVHSGQVGEGLAWLVFVQVIIVHGADEWQRCGDEANAAGSAQDGHSIARGYVRATKKGCIFGQETASESFIRQIEYALSGPSRLTSLSSIAHHVLPFGCAA